MAVVANTSILVLSVVMALGISGRAVKGDNTASDKPAATSAQIEIWGPLDLELEGENAANFTRLMQNAQRYCSRRARRAVIEGIDPGSERAHVHCYRRVTYLQSFNGDNGRD